MKKMLLVWIAAAAGLLPSLSLTVNQSRDAGRSSAYAGRLSTDSELLYRVPRSALLAVSTRDLDVRWDEIRRTQALADFQDALLSGWGLQPDSVPRLVGRRSVFFLAPAERWPFAVPVGLLEPADPGEARAILAGLPDIAYLQEGALFWVGPAEAAELLTRLSKDDGPKFPEVVPLAEIADRLTPGGLVRGCVNSAAVLRLLRESAIEACPFPFRNAAAALAADLAAVRYVAFSRDFMDGQFTTEGLVAYDPARLPVKVRQVLNPAASPVLIPASAVADPGSVGAIRSPFVVVAFRPESSAWMPWVRYVAASDPHGPLRNLAFWLDEFQQRYACNLDRDLFSVIGDQAWLLATRGPLGDSLEIVAVFELRGQKAIEGVLEDLFSWAGEQVWLNTFGILSARSWHQDEPGIAIRGLTLRTPLALVQGPAFEVTGRYLIIALQPPGLETGRAWIKSIAAVSATDELEASGSCGTILAQPSELAQLIHAIHPAGVSDSDGRVWQAVVGLMADSGTLRVDLDYERDAVRFRGRLPIRQ
jgi:hypothetical protein